MVKPETESGDKPFILRGCKIRLPSSALTVPRDALPSTLSSLLPSLSLWHESGDE